MPVISCTVEVHLWDYFRRGYPSAAMCIFYNITDEVLLTLSLRKFSQSFKEYSNIWNMFLDIYDGIY